MDELHVKASLPNRVDAISLIRHRAMGLHYLEYELEEWRSNLNKSTLTKINTACSNFLSQHQYE